MLLTIYLLTYNNNNNNNLVQVNPDQTDELTTCMFISDYTYVYLLYIDLYLYFFIVHFLDVITNLT